MRSVLAVLSIVVLSEVSTSAAPAPTAYEVMPPDAGGNFIANWSGCDGCDFILEVATDAEFYNRIPGYEGLNVGATFSAFVTVPAPAAYYYRLRAVDGEGESDYSNTILVPGPSAMFRNYRGQWNPDVFPSPVFVGDAPTIRADIAFSVPDVSAAGVLFLDRDPNVVDTLTPWITAYGQSEVREFGEAVMYVSAQLPRMEESGWWSWAINLSFMRWEPYFVSGNFWVTQSSGWWLPTADSGEESQLAFQVLPIPAPPSAYASAGTTQPETTVDLVWQRDADGRNFGSLVVRYTGDFVGGPFNGATYAPGDTIGNGVVVVSDPFANSFQDTGLQPGTTYGYRVYLENGGYYSWIGVDALATTAASTVPDPLNPAAEPDPDAPSTGIRLSWTDGTQGAGSVLVVRSADDQFTPPAAGVGYNPGGLIGDDTVVYVGSGASAVDSGLQSGTTYRYRFYSRIGDAYSVGVDASATTDAAGSPVMAVLGTDGSTISDGDMTTAVADGTDFGTVAVGAFVEHEFTIANNGTASLEFGAITVSGAHASDVTVLTSLGTGWARTVETAPWAARYEPVLLSYDNKLWLMGGGRVGYFTNDVWSSTDGVAWTKVTAQAGWPGRMMHAACVFNGRMWVLGGYTSAYGLMNDVWSSVDGVTWTREVESAPWAGRAGLAVVVHDDRLWVMGGDAGTMVSDVWYSENGRDWTQATPEAPWSGRTGFGGVAFGGELWVIGGGMSGALRDDIWHSSDGLNWTEVVGTKPPARYFGDTVVHGGRIWVLGGVLEGGGRANDVWWSADGLNWNQAADAPWSVRDSFSLVSHQGLLWLAGGYDGSYFGEVWYLGASSIPPGGSTTFSLRFSPVDGGERLATVSLPNNDPDHNPYDFAVGGFGSAPARPTVSWSAESVSVSENDGSATVAVHLSFAADATVDVAVASGSVAQRGADFTLSATQFVFTASGPVSQNLVVTGLNDALVEPNESATLTLTRLRGATSGDPSSLALTVIEEPCPPAVPPTLSNPGDRTFTVGSPGTFSVSAADGNCPGVQLQALGLPANARFDVSPSGSGVTGLLSWTPGLGQVGTHPIRFLAEDAAGLQSSIVIRVYVRRADEATDPAGVPVSQTNWHVGITNIEIGSSGNVTLVFDSASGLAYDIYYSDNSFGGAMTWRKVGDPVETDGEFGTNAVSPGAGRRFFQVVPLGAPPTSNGVWGVIEPTVQPAGFTLMSAPLDGDRRFDGPFGGNLATALTGDDGLAMTVGDKVHIMEASQNYRTLHLFTDGTWRESNGSLSEYELMPGQGFYVQRNESSTARPRLTGPVGAPYASTAELHGGWNIAGTSHGRPMLFTSVFAPTNVSSGSIVGNWDETGADIVVIEVGGAFRRFWRTGDGQWLDMTTFQPPAVTIEPGSAFFYYSQGTLGVRF